MGKRGHKPKSAAGQSQAAVSEGTIARVKIWFAIKPQRTSMSFHGKFGSNEPAIGGFD
jgi:hypothetical protein